MRLPKSIQERFREHGRVGGQTRARNLTAAARAAIARHAAIRRWTRARFGEDSFAALGLPGGQAIDKGLTDLAFQTESVESLLVSLAAPRLRREGLPVPAAVHHDPELRLYRMLEQTDGDLAHARYLAYLRQAESFANACGAVRRRQAARGNGRNGRQSRGGRAR